MSDFIPAFAQIDTRILIAIAILAIIAFVWSIVKKAFKVCIVFLLVSLFAGVGVPAVENVQKNYGIGYDRADEVLHIKVAGELTEISIKELKEAQTYSITLDQGASDTKLSLYYERKNGTAVSERGANAIDLPNFMAKVLCTYFDRAGIKYKLNQATGVLG